MQDFNLAWLCRMEGQWMPIDHKREKNQFTVLSPRIQSREQATRNRLQLLIQLDQTTTTKLPVPTISYIWEYLLLGMKTRILSAVFR